MKIYIGTSGFSYPGWKGTFYPPDLSSSKWLQYYSTKFNSLELNYTFYKFPTLKPLQRLYNSTPDNFVFSLKAHKIITHSMRMNHASEKIKEYMAVVEEGLQNKVGCILFQLPPSFKYSDENLDQIIESVPPSPHNVIEFRHDSWWNKNTIAGLKKHKLTFCNVSFPKLPEQFYKTTLTTYIRMHGVPKLFVSSYSQAKLKEMIGKIPADVKECFIYFNNTSFEAGFSNALSVQKLMKNEMPESLSDE